MSKSENPLLFTTGDDSIATDVTLRDLFAAAALAGLLNGRQDSANTLATEAFKAADAMLAARARETDDGQR
jgi:hypothetical protein